MEAVGRAVEDIAAMRVRGAEAIARHAVDVLCRYAAKGVPPEALEEAASRLSAARPTAATLGNAVGAVHDALRRGMEPDEAGRRFAAWQEDVRRRVVAHGAAAVAGGGAVLTHCHSSTVVDVLAAARPGLVLCTETRPFGQGHITARALADAGLPVIFIVDSAVPRALEKHDVAHLVVGADAVAQDGALVNKVGTLNAARAAQEAGVPFTSVATSLKRTPQVGGDVAVEEREAGEVWKGPPAGVRVWNPVFDVVPAPLVDAYVTERGVHAPGDVAALPPWSDGVFS